MKADSNLKILLIDDMSSMRTVILNMLKDLGFENVKTATNGMEAWSIIYEDLAQEKFFDLIISDLNLPKLNGLQLLEKIKSHEKLKDVPFLIITSEADQETIAKAIKAGVNRFLLKPFNKYMLKEKIEKIFPDKPAAA